MFSYELHRELHRTSAYVYGLPYKARCLTALAGESDKTKFLLGTLSLRDDNELHLIEVKEEDKLEVRGVLTYSHPHEIWHIAPCPSDPDLLFTCYNTGSEHKASLWRIRGEDMSDLREVCQLGEHTGSIKAVLWRPVEEEGAFSEQVVSIDNSSIKLWDVNIAQGPLGTEDDDDAADVAVPPSPSFPSSAAAGTKCISTIQASEGLRLMAGVWNPNSTDEVITACDGHIIGWDLRSSQSTFNLQKAHGSGCVRDVDFNPNELYYFVSGGDDSFVKFWDQRNTSAPLRVLDGHSHWICTVKYNRWRDQLLLSSSTDNSVNLWKVSSLTKSRPTSSSLANPMITPSTPTHTDYLIKSYDEHEHSVYSVAWGRDESSPYIFASLSYDGRVVINRVPDDEVDKIQQGDLDDV